MSKLTLKDLKEQGLELSKMDAQELHSRISHIAQRGNDINEVYPGTSTVKPDKKKEESPADGTDKPIEQKKLVAGNFNKKGNTLAAEGYKIGDMYPRIEGKPNAAEDDDKGSETTAFTVTEQHLEEKSE